MPKNTLSKKHKAEIAFWIEFYITELGDHLHEAIHRAISKVRADCIEGGDIKLSQQEIKSLVPGDSEEAWAWLKQGYAVGIKGGKYHNYGRPHNPYQRQLN